MNGVERSRDVAVPERNVRPEKGGDGVQPRHANSVPRPHCARRGTPDSSLGQHASLSRVVVVPTSNHEFTIPHHPIRNSHDALHQPQSSARTASIDSLRLRTRRDSDSEVSSAAHARRVRWPGSRHSPTAASQHLSCSVGRGKQSPAEAEAEAELTVLLDPS